MVTIIGPWPNKKPSIYYLVANKKSTYLLIFYYPHSQRATASPGGQRPPGRAGGPDALCARTPRVPGPASPEIANHSTGVVLEGARAISNANGLAAGRSFACDRCAGRQSEMPENNALVSIDARQ